MKKPKPFRFKQFSIHHDLCAMKVGTDGVLLGAWADVEQDEQILDIGTGSGLIAIMIAQRSLKAHILGIEIDVPSAQQAHSNVLASPWKERLSIQQISLQDFADGCSNQFDHIVSNPPYFEIGTASASKSRGKARQQHCLSLGTLIQKAKLLMHEHSKLTVILPTKEALEFENMAAGMGLFPQRKCHVHPKKDKPIERILTEFVHSPSTMEQTSLIIQHKQRNDWTVDYIQLTQAFYLKM